MTTQNPENLPDSADVVIVGAGVAGLYCAWRLLRQDPGRRVVMLERLNRTGGRLDTDLVKIRNESGGYTVRDEEGGMRFNYGMKELMALNGALDLCDDIVPFPMAPTEGKNHNRYFMRGRRFTVEDSNRHDHKVWGEIYNLAEDEKHKTPVEILTEVYHRIVEHNNETPPADPTPDYWQRFRLEFEWDGIAMNRWQLWGLLRHMGYSEECVTMLSHAIGFEGPFLSLASAGEAFQIIEDFPHDPTYFTFRKGFSTLPDALRGRVEAAGGQIYLSTNLDAIHADGDGHRLTVTVAPPDRAASPFVENGIRKEIRAGKVILAVASKALTGLYATSPVFNQCAEAEQLSSDLQSVVDMRLLKINLYFKDTWWQDEEILEHTITYGPNFTDLPINAVYPFYSLKGSGDDERPAALTIYCDFNNTNFWQGLQNVEPKFDSPLQREHSTPPQVIFPASVKVVKEARKQFAELFGIDIDSIPEPVMTSYRLWGGESDFGFAYHQWAMDADDRAVMRRLVEPVANIYTCNEAYSDMEGWVNGSLRSADHVLARFNISPLVDDPNTTPCTQG